MNAHAVLALALLAALVLPAAHAQTGVAPWSWSNYSGTTSWNVVYTEDDTGCQGGIVTTQDQITITHNQATASFTDEHGPVTGTFVSPNVLHVKGRPVTDSTGATSVISDYDLFFTTDCLSFAASYSWDYSDQYMSCSGTTRLAGTNAESSCPEAGPVNPPPATQPSGQGSQGQTMSQRVADAHSDLRDYLNEKDQIGGVPEDLQLLKAKVEGSYEGILHDDPGNPQANADMAQLRRSDGNEDEFRSYMDKALQGGFDQTKTAQSMQGATAKELGMSVSPSPRNNPFIRAMANEENNWQGPLYGSDPQKDSSDKTTWMMRIYSIIAPPKSIVDTLVFE